MIRAGKYVLYTIGSVIIVVFAWPVLWALRRDVRVRGDLVVDTDDIDDDPGTPVDIDEDERIG